MARRKDPGIPDALLDQLLSGADPKTAFDPGGLLDSLKKALAERALNAEMEHHLSGTEGAGNSRNGYGRKTVTTETGKFDLAVPGDRQASFDPRLIAKYQRRFPGFDEKIVSMYARGMSNREIVGHLQDLYGVEVSPDLISVVTDAVLEEVAVRQARPLDPVYPIVFFDALRVKVRDEGFGRNKAVHIALGVHAAGTKEIAVTDLPREGRDTLALIKKGGPFPYAKDGTVFGNREGRLPRQKRGYYREYTVRTPGERTRGARRIVAGKQGDYWYTDDHYETFRRIRE